MNDERAGESGGKAAAPPCTCCEYGIDLACPQHGAAENARRLKKAKREMRRLLEVRRQGLPLKAALTRASRSPR